MNESGAIKLLCFDLNFVYDGDRAYPSAAHDWAFIDPQEYFDFHMNMECNAILLHAYTWSGYAFYPTKLGPVAPGPGAELLPRVYELARKAKIQFWSYFCVANDLTLSNQRIAWRVPGSYVPGGYPPCYSLAPESPWTDLLCDRIREFLQTYPVDWLLFDNLLYGNLTSDRPLQPASFVEKPFEEIIGRRMPSDPGEITADEGVRYKREVLARQFYRIRDVVRETSPKTKICFNLILGESTMPFWTDHPVISESAGLFAECSRGNVIEWLLGVRKPSQRVITTIVGCFDDPGECDPTTWRKWYERGCDLFGYVWGTPPLLEPHTKHKESIEIVHEAFNDGLNQ